MNTNKEILTIKKLQARNELERIVGIVITVIGFLFMLVGAGISIGIVKSGNMIWLFFIVPFILLSLYVLYLGIKRVKKEKKENVFIDNRDFKIVEDKIYDRYMDTSKGSEGRVNYHYFVFSKIYGQISTDALTYRDAKKDDSLYLLFYGNNERIESSDKIINELERNNKIVDQGYLASVCDLSPELIDRFIPYDESLGELNYRIRIQNAINKSKEAKGEVLCKGCDKKYNLNKHEACPKCGLIHNFDIEDVLYEKSWYLRKGFSK